MMKAKYVAYLISQGYKEITPSGNPSTTYSYTKRIDNVCDWENIDWETLREIIDTIVPQYELGGSKEEYGSKSHRTVINALYRFQECVHKGII